MDCEYTEFLLCDLCPKVKECKSDYRYVSVDYLRKEKENEVRRQILEH